MELGTIVLELIDLRQVGGVDEQQTRGGTDQRGGQQEQAEHHAADSVLPGNCDLPARPSNRDFME